MKVENVRNTDDIERYIEGCINDFEMGISDKSETIVHLAELVAHVYIGAKKEMIRNERLNKILHK